MYKRCGTQYRYHNIKPPYLEDIASGQMIRRISFEPSARPASAALFRFVMRLKAYSNSILINTYPYQFNLITIFQAEHMLKFLCKKGTRCRFKASPDLLTKSNICSILFMLLLKKNENSRNILGEIMPLIKGGNSILEDQNDTYAREERKSPCFSQS